MGRDRFRRVASPLAFTLIELVIVIVVIGLLAALLFWGLQSAREAARRSQCQVHLRQIGLAFIQYEATQRMFPPAATLDGLSFHVTLLPYLELNGLYERIRSKKDQLGVNEVVIEPERPSLFECPSDPVGRWSDEASGTSYAGSVGTWVVTSGNNGFFRRLQDPFMGHRAGPVRAADITDGLSTTAAVCEILQANGKYERLRVNWNTQTYHDMNLPEFMAECLSLPPNPREGGWQGDPYARGNPWTFGDLSYTLYNHVLPPNAPSCYNRFDVQRGMATAASNHSGGVNLLFADGRTDFVAAATTVEVWQELGSINSGNARP